MNKIYAIVLLIILGLTATFSACGDPYKNMKMDITSGKTVEIQLTENTEVETPEGELDPNTALVEATITDVKDNISKVVNFVSGDESKLQVITQETQGEVTTALIRAFRPGVVNLEAISKEGGQREMITVFIYRKVSGVEFSSTYTPAVIANGVPTKIDDTQVLFTPSDANIRDLEYSLVGNPSGATIDADGYLTVTNSELSSVRVRIQPTLRENDDVYAEIDVAVLPSVDTSMITFNSTLGGTTQDLPSALHWIKNDPQSSLHTVSFAYYDMKVSEILRLRAVIADTQKIIEKESNRTNNSISLSALDTGNTSATFEIYYVGHEDIVVYSKTVNYDITEAVNAISVNGGVTDLTIFNTTSTSAYKGVELVVELNPKTASNRKYKLQASDNFYNHLIIKNATGGSPFDENGFINSASKIYITHDGQIANMDFVLTIEPAGDYICDVLNINVTCLTSVEQITTAVDSIMLGYSESLQVGAEMELEYSVLPEGALKETVQVVSNNENVAIVYFDEVNYTHKVVSTGVGVATISFIVNGRVLKNITCECVAPYSSFLVDIDSPTINPNVSGKTMINEVDNFGVVVGKTLESAVIKVGANIKINVNSYPTNSKIKSINYKIEAVEGNANLAKIDENGILRVESQVEKFKVIIEATGYAYDLNGTGDITEVTTTKEVLFTAIMPIQSISMNTNYVKIYDINTVGIDEISQAQARLYVTINPFDATINTDDVVWSVSNSEFENLLSVQDDGSVIITGRLQYGDERTFTVLATVQEYDKTYSVQCKVTITKAKTVTNILLSNYDEARGVYLKSSDINSGYEGDTYSIKAQAMPADAKNTQFKYFAFDINAIDDSVDGWYWDEELYTRVDSSRIQVSDTGLVTTVRGASGGYSIVWVVPADNIRSEPINFDEIKIKRALLIYVADGSIENPYEINNYVDFVNISNAPDKSYRIVQTIDFASINNYAPIGTVDKPFTGTITGKYTLANGQTIINSLTNFKFNSQVNTTAYQGIFGIIGENGKVSDLNITVNASTIDITLEDGHNYSFGYVAGLNNGIITNVTVRFNGNLTINNNNQGTVNIGGIVGDNVGTISNSRSITYNNFGINVNTANVMTYAGGLAGVNRGNIEGQFEYVGDMLGGSGSDYEFNIDFNDESLNSSITLTANSSKVMLGGIVAVNDKDIQGVYSMATIRNYSNVGGIVALNNGAINSARFTGVIEANEKAGGIAGENAQNATIVFGIVEICDDEVHFKNLQSGGVVNFGGVVGLNSGEINYSYINSYSAQRSNDNDNVDMAVVDGQALSFGAFVGTNESIINKCFANVQLDGGKVFYGENNGTITLSYTLSYWGEFTTINQAFYGGDGSDSNNFIIISSMNFGLPMILIDKNAYNDKGDVLLTESPKSIEVSVYGELNKSSYGINDSTNRYYKVSNSQLILLLNNSLVSEQLNNNTYDLSKMFNINIQPSSQRNKTVLVTVISGQDVLSIEGSTLKVLKEGYAVLRFASDLDSAVFTDIEVYVSTGITDINVNNIEDKTINDQIYRELKIQLNTSFNFDITNINQLATGDTKTQYSALQSGGYLFSFESDNFVEFDKCEVVDDKSFLVRYADSQIITALQAGVSNAIINPYISAMFYEDGQAKEIKYVLSDVKYEFSLYVYRGLTDVLLQTSAEEIMPNTTLNYQVTLKTDLQDSVLNSLYIYEGDITGDEEQTYESFDLSNSTINDSVMGNFKKEVSSTSKFEINIINIQFNDATQEKVITFEIIPSKELNGDKAILEKVDYTLVFNATLGSEEKISKQFKLTLKPQVLSTILMNHYNDGKDFDPNLTGAGEEVSSRIIPGQYGLLVVNLWPEYSVFDRLEITSSVASNDVITFEQVYYNVDANNYDTKVENTQIINNGISVKRQSTKRYNELTGQYEYEFDGRIFLRTITGTQVQTGQVFTVTISAYNEGESTPYITQTLNLTALQAPYLTFDFTSGRQYKGISHEYYAAENTNYGFTMVTESAISESTGITTSITDESGAVVANATMVKSGDTLVSNNLQTINYVIPANTNFVKGKKYYVEMIVTKNVSGVTTKARIVNTLYIVDFLVTGFNIVDGQILDPKDPNYILVSNGLLSRPLSTTGWQISISLQTTASEENLRTRVTAVERQLNGKDKLMGQYYNPWKYMVMTGVNAGQFDTITSENVSNNFVLSNDEDGTGYKLVGKSIANVDTLMADFSYYYDENGNFTLTNDPTISIDGNPSMQFRLDFSLSSSQDHPLPVTTKDEFLNMEDGIDYILMEDIDLGENYEPLTTNINSFDGNGYTITIGSFQLPIESSDSVYVGLFSKVNSSTLLKNVTVKFSSAINLNLVNYSNVYFGAIAGENSGVITNAEVDYLDEYGTNSIELVIQVQSSSDEGQTTSAIGGAVGQNSGIITNSRVNNLNLEGNGTIGGFVGVNNNVISSSYVYAPTIQSLNGNTGGFVAENNGEINTSYVRGVYSKTNQTLLRAGDASLIAVGKVGGFVYQNYGAISDSYANIKITSQSRSAGFVYDNTRNGSIYNCLSLSDIIQNSIAHMPFVGTDESDRFLNQGELVNAYFYQNENDKFVAYDIDGNENPAQKMTEEDLALTSSLSGFAFSDKSSEFSGVWVQPSAVYDYFNTSDTFDSNSGSQGFSKMSFKQGIPELVAPNVIARSVRKIDSVETNQSTGESIYNYVYVTQSNAEAGEKVGYEYGTIHNQALINDVEDFVYLYEKYQNNQLVEVSNINSRVINTIDFSTYEKNLNTSKVTLSAIIEGNGLSMNNISVVSNVDEKYTEFGLFKNIKGNVDTGVISAIKNLTFSFIEVKSSSSNIVGSIAGSMHNANLIDIEVQGNNVAVKGSNIVGGVVGLVTGNSTLYKITTNISANSGFRNSGNNTISFTANDGTTLTVEKADNVLYVNDSLFYSNVDETLQDVWDKTPLKNTVNFVSYAGAIAGVIETKHEENIMECYLTPNVYDLTVDGNVKVIGSTAGGVIGMAGLYTFVSNVKFVINQSSFISGDDIAGGLIGELRGKLSQGSIIHTNQDSINNLTFGATNDDINLTLFKSNTTTKASGGLVGFNLGGTILDCISYAYVRNPYSTFAGGAVGVTISGNIKAVIATGSVLGKESVGGLIGGIVATNDTGMNNFYNYNLLPLYYNNTFNIDNSLLFNKVENADGTIIYDQNSMVLSYVMAGNNWTSSDQNTLNTIANWGGLIGFFENERLDRTYINTTHPQDEDSDVNLINFYVAGGTNTDLLKTRGNEEGSGGDWMHIAEPITFNSLTPANKELYYGSYYRFVWDLSGDSKYPTINIKAVPDTIEIASASDLLQIIWNLSANYLIVDDIDLSKIDSWLPLGTDVEPFSGTLRASPKVTDSSGVATRNTYYQIQNLNIVSSNLQYVGLFGVTGFNYKTQKGAIFENLVITVEQIVGNDFQSTDSYTGALVADARGAQIINVVTAPASINSMIASSGDYTGGIVGRLSNLKSDVDVDEEDETKGKIIIKSSMTNSLSTLNIGIVNRRTNVNAGRISHVGGAIGQVIAGTVDGTASNQKIGLAVAVTDGLTGKVTYQFLDMDKDYNDSEYYSQSLYIGGLIGSNSSQFLDAGDNQGNTQQELIVKNSFSNSNIEIAKLNLVQVGTRIDTIIGGFAGVLDENIDVESSFSTGEINTKGSVDTGETATNKAIISGFVGKINLSYEESTEQITNRCYSLVTLLDQSNYATIKGFGYIGYGDIDVTNAYNAQSVANNSYYEHYYALVIDYDEYFGTSSHELRNIFSGFEEFKIDKNGIYYPVIAEGDYVLGVNDRVDYSVYGNNQGSKLNPILINDESSLLNVAYNANNRDEYLYYLVTTDIDNISTHVEDAQGNIISNNSPMIDSFQGFINGNGFYVGGFTVKESPKTFDADYNIIEDDSTVENVGLVRVLLKGSYISGLSLDNVYIEYQSNSEISNSTINVGGLVGTMESGSAVFASTVSGEIYVKGAQYKIMEDGVEKVSSRNQTLNIGGIVGYSNGGSVINSANYARVASFDYTDYKNIVGQKNPSLNTINAGGIVGKAENGASMISVFSISQFNFVESNATYVQNLNYGSIAGFAQYSTIRNWYAKVDLVQKEYDRGYAVTARVGQEVMTSGGTNTNLIEDENVQTLTTSSNLAFNYGYEYAPLLEEGVPNSRVKLLNSDGVETEYYIAGNTESLIFLLNNNYNVALDKDIYLSSNYSTVDTYTGEINGQYNSIYGLDKVLINNVNVETPLEEGDKARIENVSFSGITEYTGEDKYVVGTLGSNSVVSVVDLKTTANTLNLARNTNEGVVLQDINSDGQKIVTTANKWMNLSPTNDISGDRIRSFVEYWDEIDVRGVFLSEVEGTYTVIEVDEEGNEVPTIKTEMRNRINDAYELAKFAKLINDGDRLELNVTEINHNSTIDLSGKIWRSLPNFTDSLVSSSEVETEKPVISNMYTEGQMNVGFISTYNSAEGRVFNIEFKNAKLVPYVENADTTTTYERFGVVAGTLASGSIDSVNVSGIINIDVPNANFVGTMFGVMRGTLTSVKAEGEATDVEQSVIKGLDFVGGIAGQIDVSRANLKYVDNNYNVSGRDFVGGYAGYAKGSQSPVIYGYEKVVDTAINDIYHKNTGNVQGRNFVGGLVGFIDNVNLSSVRNEGNVSASGYAVGGLAGYTNAQITSSVNGQDDSLVTYNNAIVSSTATSNSTADLLIKSFEEQALNIDDIGLSNKSVQAGYFYGGLVGYLDKADILCAVPKEQNTQGQRKNENNATILGENFVGGIAGFNNQGNIYGDNIYLEEVDNSVLGVQSFNSVTGKSFVGGIVGLNYSTAEGNGIVKDAVVQISATGDNITGSYCVGGIVGANFGYVWSVSAQGIMGGQVANFGGIVGYNDGDVQYANSAMIITLSADNNSMALTSIITCQAGKNYYVGGVVGHNVGTMKNCAYTKGQQSASNAGTVKFLLEGLNEAYTIPNIYVGGVCGVNEGDINAVYVDNQTYVVYEWYKGQTTSSKVYIAGLVAKNASNGVVRNTYSLAKIQNIENSDLQGQMTITEPDSDNTIGGGLVYTNEGKIESSYARYNLVIEGSGTVSDDCYVMNSVSATITEDQEQEDGSTVSTTKEITQLQVDSNYKTQFGNFLKNKYTAKKVTISGVNYKVTSLEHPTASIQIELISKDGSFADTEVLVNNVGFSANIWDDDWFNDNMKCVCGSYSALDPCPECQSRGCCIGCECTGGLIQNLDCIVCQEKQWVKFFDSDTEYFKQVRENIFNNVVFSLAFTGLKTQANGTTDSTIVPEEDIQSVPTTMPSTGFLGKGTLGDPYRIYTVDDIETLNRQLKFGNSYLGTWFILMNDLDLGDTQGMTIGTNEYPFEGNLDGNNKTIKNNRLQGIDNVAFFPILAAGAQIMDLTFVDCSSNGNKNVAIVVGENRGLLKGVEVYQTSSGVSELVVGEENVGGVVGYNNSNGRISNCSVGISVKGNKNVGGIAGFNEGGSITQSETVLRRLVSGSGFVTFSAEIKGADNVGGIVGYQNGYASISECLNEVIVNASSGYGGGIVGFSEAQPYSDDTYSITDIINTGVVQGSGRIGQISGRLSSKAQNVIATVKSNLLGEGSTTTYLDNLINIGGVQSDTILYEINGFKREVYKDFDFNTIWGMSPTQLDVNTKVYSNPKVSALSNIGIEYNYPKLLNLNSSKDLLSEYNYFSDQFFNVNDIESSDPTIYIETIEQLRNYLDYFLGEYDVTQMQEGSEFDEKKELLNATAKKSIQYSYPHASIKVNSSAFEALNVNISSMSPCKNGSNGYALSYSDWTTLPAINNRNIDFGGITIKINTFNNKYYIGDPSNTYAGFISSFTGNAAKDVYKFGDTSYDAFSKDKISNLNIEVSNIAAARVVGGIIGILNNGSVDNCSIKYTGSATVNYLGAYIDESIAGILVGQFAEPAGNADNRGSGLYNDYEQGKISNSRFESDLGENIFVVREENGTNGYTTINYHTNY